MRRLALGLTLAALLGASLGAGPVSRTPHELGAVIPKEVALKEGKVLIRVDSGGCTDKAGIRAHVQREDRPGAPAPHYVVTFERIRVDDCKAMLFEGVWLEYDLVRDLGIAGPHTLSVAPPHAAEQDLKRELQAATAKAMELEIVSYEGKLKTAQAANAATFRSRITELKRWLEALRQRDPADLTLATGPEEAGAGLLEAAYGPLASPRKQLLSVVLKTPCRDGSLLEVAGTSKSGPFFHVAGIAGGDYGRLKPGRTYELVAYLVYRREYFALIQDHYVYIADVQ